MSEPVCICYQEPDYDYGVPCPRHEWGMETHEPDPDDQEPPDCGQGWCCGCDVHPRGKPWGPGFLRWERHYAEFHPDRK